MVLWIAFLGWIGMYCLLVVRISGLPGRSPRPDPLAGTLAILPYLLPLALLPAGLGVYNALALRGADGTRWGQRPQTGWGRVQTGFIAMMAVFEFNAIVGLMFFFLGSSASRFFVFAAGTAILQVVALLRLRATWPAE